MRVVSGEDQHFTNYATHAANTGYVIVDVFITGVPTRLLHFWLPELFGVSFIVFSAIYWAISGGVIYDALDYGENLSLALAYVAGAIVAILVVQFLLFLLYWLRVVLYGACTCCSCCLRHDDDLSNSDNASHLMDLHGNDSHKQERSYMTSIEIT